MSINCWSQWPRGLRHELSSCAETLGSFFFFFLMLRIVGGWSPSWVHSAPRPFTVLLCLPRVIVRMENFSVEWRLAGETEVLGETCPSATLSTTNPTWPDPGSNPGRRGGKPGTNRLSYGAAKQHWDLGFESHLRHGCLCVRLFGVCIVLCVRYGLAKGWSLVQGVLPSV
jgi:hypothetical protein